MAFSKFLIYLFCLLLTITYTLAHPGHDHPPEVAGLTEEPKITWCKFQSIDTMKYSRDLAREKLTNMAFDETIDTQVKAIAETGATHVAIATPYDIEFLPYLRRWVEAARKYKLNVWFRGNFSGWEGWFNYDKISREQHITKTTEFILANKDLFEDGDVFTACPECENGGPGDPRSTGDVEGFRNFLITEYQNTQRAFFKINKGVLSNFNSMNGDVAKLIMDKKTTQNLGGIVTVDHYVESPKKLADDISILAAQSGGKIVLGEFGAPIPDIHGDMSEEEQAKWVDETLDRLSTMPEVYGVNYWTHVGSSTAIWHENGISKTAVQTLTKYYSPKTLEIIVLDETNNYISDAYVRADNNNYRVGINNSIKIPYIKTQSLINISAENYITQETSIERLINDNKVILIREKENIFFKIKKLLLTLVTFFQK